MSSVNISEDDFAAVAAGAWALKREGDEVGAATLDKLARKINAAMSSRAVRVEGFSRMKLSWEQVPSVFDTGRPE